MDIVCLNENKLKCKSQKNRNLHFFACFCDYLVQETAQFHVFQFWCASSNSLTELAPQKQVASILFTAMYSFMAGFGTNNRGVGVEHRGVCVECSKQTENLITNPKLGNKKLWGER